MKISPDPMSEIRSDSRVRTRGFVSKIRVRVIAKGDSSEASGSDS